MTGYSDRINHALAFAAKHHDQQVRRGTKAPYATQPANIAIILTRYGLGEDTIVAGILLDVVKDYVREGLAGEALQSRVGEKFGHRALELALVAAGRRSNDEGMDLSADEQREDLLDRLGDAPDDGRVLVAAQALHAAGTLLADLRRTVDREAVWSRVPGGRALAIDRYHRLHRRLVELGPGHGIVDELGATLGSLAALGSA